ncbi:MAG: 30S ribosomal protein S7 [Elusimicrobiaceae bacterium]|jgi:small subunit ribosomal protein S7|uniref:Small ribosomal subunit protein uS7 n=1 Tax=Candidatus Avelusimicrobium gallicola TaxID=2562704 RepID=A0A928HDS5_9BACT|nr:30S ribosomal protein S7 [Elusimicrobium sp.]MBQ9971583.1 30S ribosomal protein S7 [Elusimicrobiaceae bacterium]MBR2391952.1 30S ribosomal protein S7 [Elusimicrobiaceae bacterium]
MPRKGLRPRDRRPQPAPDYKYNSVLVARFINKLNFEGKTATATRILDDAMAIIAEKTNENALEVFNKCIENVRPLVEVKARRVGGANYQVPTEVKPLRSTSLAMRWLIGAAQSRKGRPMAEKLAEEIILGSKKEGTAFKKREDVHKMAEANRAFAHFKW